MIWDPRGLPKEGVWEKPGPVLCLEFSRVSSDCRLTLVIDREHGDACETFFALSPRADLDDAIEDLRDREGTGKSKIGFVDLRRKNRRGRDPKSIRDIQAWAVANQFDGVVWTDLEANFERETGDAFSVSRATAYLDGLSATARKRAMKYIANAPEEISTPVRRELVKGD